MKKELRWALGMQRKNPLFIIPIIMDGNFISSVPEKMDNETITIKYVVFRLYSTSENAIFASATISFF